MTIHFGRSQSIRWCCIPILVLALTPLLAISAAAQAVQTNLVSNQPGFANFTDTAVSSPGALAFTPSGRFVIGNSPGTAQTFTPIGSQVGQTIMLAPPPGLITVTPSAVLATNTGNFVPGFNGSTAPATLIFTTQNGTINALVPSVSASQAGVVVDNSALGTVYGGAAIASTPTGDELFVADETTGTIDVFDTNFAPVTPAGAFTDFSLPAGFVPAGVTNVNGQLFVSYAQQQQPGSAALVPNSGGVVDVYDTNGNLVRTFAAEVSNFNAEDVSNAPTSIAVAPGNFDKAADAILVANSGNGTISEFAPNGTPLGLLDDQLGVPVVIPGLLQAIAFSSRGQGAHMVISNKLYFAAGSVTGIANGAPTPSFVGVLQPGRMIKEFYTENPLISDVPFDGALRDRDLINPWGLMIDLNNVAWIAENGAGLVQAFREDKNGRPRRLGTIVVPPPTDGTGPSTPTGLALNPTNDFSITNGANFGLAAFFVATEDGTISGWSPDVDTNNAVLLVDNSSAGAVYKGVTVITNTAGNYLAATNFSQGTVDVFDDTFTQTTLTGSFTDPNIPAGFSPFGIRVIGNVVVVTYALVGPSGVDDQPGPGNGFVDIYDTSGNLISTAVAGAPLNSPWGLSPSPWQFGKFSDALLVGNFGDGTINAFDPTTGVFLGPLNMHNGDPIAIDGLWGFDFPASQRHTLDQLIFASRPNSEADGLVGRILGAPPEEAREGSRAAGDN